MEEPDIAFFEIGDLHLVVFNAVAKVSNKDKSDLN